MEVDKTSDIVRFGDFQVDLKAGELTKGGTRIRVPLQSIQVLGMLTARPGEVVAREEVRKALWPNDTIVEFDHSINAAINRLRQALGDVAESPRYIETLPKRGYRFLMEVERPQPPPLAAPPPEPATVDAPLAISGDLVGKTILQYRVVQKLGQGGGGVVYRAEDSKLARPVALKFLTEGLSDNPRAHERFRREAHAVSALNHPNICTLYDMGEADGLPFLVMEYLDGETLGHRLKKGLLPLEQALGYAIEIAGALAYAHRHGVIHRDLKPDNIMLVKSGIKVLDFGIAKVAKDQRAESGPETGSMTEEGTIVGTLQYMAPEQLEGKDADARTDIFAFGAVLYEMLAGKKAFESSSQAGLIAAIVQSEPQTLSAVQPLIPAALDRVIKSCLAKDPDARWQGAADLTTELRWIAESGKQPSGPAPVADRRRKRVSTATIAVSGALACLLALAYFRRGGEPSAIPSYHQLTFRRGYVSAARFAPDGQTIVYSAAWEGQPIELVAARRGSPESRVLGLLDADVMAISPSGEMAISLDRRRYLGFHGAGTLARVPLAGGAPRAILGDVQEADWAPDATNLAVVRAVRGLNRLEFPIGKVLYETAGVISHPRVSPDGNLVAFLDHPSTTDDGGSVAVIDRQGKMTRLTAGWDSEQGLAWSSRGDEVWFTASPSGLNDALYAVTLSGKQRLVARVPARLSVEDIFRDGRVLMTSMKPRSGIMYLAPGAARERDLAWLDWSRPADLSADGKTLLFDETGEGGGPRYSVYLRNTDASPAVRLGDGYAASLSPDGKWAMTIQTATPSRVVMLPTGAGESTTVSVGSLNCASGTWFPDSKRILLQCSETGRSEGLYLKEPSGTPRAITPGRPTGPAAISLDGKLIAAIGEDGKVRLYSVDGNAPTSIPGLTDGFTPIQWSPDGRVLYLARNGESRAQIFRLEMGTWRNKLWKEVAPSDPAGLFDVSSIHLAADGNSYVYRYRRWLSELYLVEGLK